MIHVTLKIWIIHRCFYYFARFTDDPPPQPKFSSPSPRPVQQSGSGPEPTPSQCFWTRTFHRTKEWPHLSCAPVRKRYQFVYTIYIYRLMNRVSMSGKLIYKNVWNRGMRRFKRDKKWDADKLYLWHYIRRNMLVLKSGVNPETCSLLASWKMWN